jgi:hypothetical protein
MSTGKGGKIEGQTTEGAIEKPEIFNYKFSLAGFHRGIWVNLKSMWQ